MRKHHPKNERIKHEYLTYLEQAKQMSAASVDQVAAALAQFEGFTRHKDFPPSGSNRRAASRPTLSARSTRKPASRWPYRRFTRASQL